MRTQQLWSFLNFQVIAMTYFCQTVRGILCVAVLVLCASCSGPVAVEKDSSNSDASKTDATAIDRSSNDTKSDRAPPIVKLKTDFRYQFLIKARSRKKLSELLATARRFAMEKNWPPTALVIDVDPLSLM